MRDTYLPLALPPGLYRNGTKYQASGRWYDGSLVRFIDASVQPVGGWRYAKDDAGAVLPLIAGVPRGVISWRSGGGAVQVGFATTHKLMVLAGGVLRDITPVGYTDGQIDTKFGSGAGAYGSGVYGSGVYGKGALTSTLNEATTWQLDTFGDWLVGVASHDKKLYVWEGDFATPAEVPAGAPALDVGVVCTPERFLVALGAEGNVRKVAWPSLGTVDDWTPTALNTAGDFEIPTNGRLVCGRRTKSLTLLFTDVDVWSMRYIGGTLVYSFQQEGDHCGLLAPNAGAIIDTQAVWMGRENFFVYDGYIRPLPCDVRDYVFGDLNMAQATKIWAVPVSRFGEVWWFYPSSGSTEVDRYVAYNYYEKHWTVGQLARTAGVDSGATEYPIWLSPFGEIFEHETQFSRLVRETGAPIFADGSVVADGSAFADGSDAVYVEAIPFLESGPIELGTGDRMLAITQIVPDEKTLGDVQLTLFGANYPTDAETEYGPFDIGAPTDARVTARQVRQRIEQVNPAAWRVGTIRLGVKPSSRR